MNRNDRPVCAFPQFVRAQSSQRSFEGQPVLASPGEPPSGGLEHVQTQLSQSFPFLVKPFIVPIRKQISRIGTGSVIIDALIDRVRSAENVTRTGDQPIDVDLG